MKVGDVNDLEVSIPQRQSMLSNFADSHLAKQSSICKHQSQLEDIDNLLQLSLNESSLSFKVKQPINLRQESPFSIADFAAMDYVAQSHT
jgi:hypothetical protein